MDSGHVVDLSLKHSNTNPPERRAVETIRYAPPMDLDESKLVIDIPDSPVESGRLLRNKRHMEQKAYEQQFVKLPSPKWIEERCEPSVSRSPKGGTQKILTPPVVPNTTTSIPQSEEDVEKFMKMDPQNVSSVMKSVLFVPANSPLNIKKLQETPDVSIRFVNVS
ncbi:F19 [Felid gammaherpesvirus 1]|uniref:F19 n=1 Tax=Felid gammaherpesvirus 1 TaxID=2560468 RepID=A0A0M3T967_9GAMA|nr:F19 [Felis catus gammaherpesvirus 1]ALE14762.1 F19 [Felis catus gammaherpesvirus 1]